MGRSRRQPPLYEVLSSPSRRLGGTGQVRTFSPAASPPATPTVTPPSHALTSAVPSAAPVPELKPVTAPHSPAHGVHNAAGVSLPDQRQPRVHAPAAANAAPDAGSVAHPEAPAATVRVSSTMLMVGLGFLIVIIAIVWGVAFQSGQQNRDNELGELGTWKQPESGTAVPDSGGSAKPLAQAPRKTEPAKPADAPAGTDPRVAGFNYLYLGTLTLKDASAGVDFLKRNGVQAFHVVDRSRGGGNNPPCRIYASQGFAGGPRFKETEKERNDLIRRVEELGKKWQREDKGASDFRQPYWTLHKG